MKRIYKYPIEVNDYPVIKMPKESTILKVDVQKGVPCLWALVDDANAHDNRYFYLYPTGAEIDFGKKYIGSFQMLGGDLVFHLFE